MITRVRVEVNEKMRGGNAPGSLHQALKIKAQESSILACYFAVVPFLGYHGEAFSWKDNQLLD